MKKFLLSCLAVILPWLVLLIRDNPGGALVALLMQATIIGWFPASMWALKEIHQARENQEEDRNS